MNKDKMIVAGLGQCGNLLAQQFKLMVPEVSPMFINSSIDDMEGLKDVDIDINTFIYTGSDGTGKDRDVAFKFINNERHRLRSFLGKYIQFNYMAIFTSLSGGTGSGTVVEFCKSVKESCPDMRIGVYVVSPNLKEDNLALSNASEALKEISSKEFMELIESITVIDNNKMNGKYSAINKTAIMALKEAYSLTSKSKNERIDEADLEKVFVTDKGYLSILEMPRKCRDLGDSIDEAMEDSIFASPSDLSCSYAAAILSENYDLNEVAEFIKPEENFYKSHDNGSKRDMMILSGCEFPKYLLNDIEDELESRNANKKARKLGNGYKIEDKQKRIESKTRTIASLRKDEDQYDVNVDDIDW